jgi:MFS family permease
VVFLAFCVANQGGGATQGWSMLITGAFVGLLGVPAGLYGNELSLRLGLRATAVGVFLLSTLVNALFGFAAMLPYGAVVALAMAAGFIVQGNFSNLTSGLLEVTEPRRRGATVAVYSCIGFAGGFIGTLLFGVALDWFGGTARLAGRYAALLEAADTGGRDAWLKARRRPRPVRLPAPTRRPQTPQPRTANQAPPSTLINSATTSAF